MPKTVRQIEKILRTHGWTLERTVGSHRQYVHPDNPNVVTVPGAPGKQVATGTLSSILTRKRHQGAAMTECLAVYERNQFGVSTSCTSRAASTACGPTSAREHASSTRAFEAARVELAPAFD